MNVNEKLAYVKGLLEGLELDKNKPEVKVLSAIVDMLDEITISFSDIKDNYKNLADQVDEIDEDLCYLEEDFYDEEDDEKNDEDEVFYEVTCPTCKETVCISEQILLDGSIDCPNCGENLEFDLTGLSLNGKCECVDDGIHDCICSCEEDENICTCEQETK